MSKIEKITNEFLDLPDIKVNRFKIKKFLVTALMTQRSLVYHVSCKWRERCYVKTKRRSEQNKSKKIFLNGQHRERQLQPSVTRRLHLGTMTGLITVPSHGYANFSTVLQLLILNAVQCFRLQTQHSFYRETFRRISNDTYRISKFYSITSRKKFRQK